MNIAILGPQGSGKGTQAELLVKNKGFVRFETGEYFRESKDPKIVDLINEGMLVPDEITIGVLQEFIDSNPGKDLLFDGSPRTVVQYEALRDVLDKIIFLKISEGETVKRLSIRKRNDDEPEAIKKRLEIYRAQTEPVIEKARQDGILLEVDGERPIEEIHKDIMSKL